MYRMELAAGRAVSRFARFPMASTGTAAAAQTIRTEKMFIDGAWVSAASGRTLDVEAPGTRETE